MEKKSKKLILRVFLVIGLAISVAALAFIVWLIVDFSSQFRVLPEEERYHRLKDFRDSLIIDESYEIVSENYFGDGVWTRARYVITISGDSAAKDIESQILSRLDESFCEVQDLYIQCNETNPTVKFRSNGDFSTLELIDPLGGRSE